MPIIWIAFPTATSPAVQPLKDKPAELEEYISSLVRAAHEPNEPEPRLLHLYFEVGAERAYAVVKDLDDYIWAKAVTRILGADYVTKLLNVSQATEAITRSQTLLGGGSRA